MTVIINGDTGIDKITDGSVVQADLAGGGLYPKGPAFSAYDTGGNQTINHSTFTKVNFNTELWDTNNNFASSTFTPTVAGYYQLSASFSTNGYPANSANNLISIQKNGNNIQRGSGGYIATGSWYYATVSTLVYANGTTDYFDVYAFQASGSSVTIQGTSREHRTFCGVLVSV